jgi:hypothetical protein
LAGNLVESRRCRTWRVPAPVGTALPALEEEEVATSRARGIRIVKTETEIERRKLISQKSSKVNKLFGKSKRNHWRNFPTCQILHVTTKPLEKPVRAHQQGKEPRRNEGENDVLVID